jgi:hypothetical protein
MAVNSVGVGGTVRKYPSISAQRPTRQSFDYEVVRINKGSARLRDKGNLDEKRLQFGAIRDVIWAAVRD